MATEYYLVPCCQLKIISHLVYLLFLRYLFLVFKLIFLVCEVFHCPWHKLKVWFSITISMQVVSRVARMYKSSGGGWAAGGRLYLSSELFRVAMIPKSASYTCGPRQA